jgi:hypothetical protein
MLQTLKVSKQHDKTPQNRDQTVPAQKSHDHVQGC